MRVPPAGPSLMLALAAAVAAPGRPAPAATLLAAADCPAPAALGPVGRVIDAQTLRLADGRSLRLAGIVVPDEEREAAAGLLAAIAGGAEAAAAAGVADRYGRIAAQAYLAGRNGAPVWAQHALVAAGLAFVMGAAHARACLAALIEAEQAARTAGAGLWSRGHGPRFAADDPSLSRRSDLYRIVEGRVLSLGRTRAAIYLNFGRDWATDFTAVIFAPDASRFGEAGIDLDRLEGARVRVRGWLTLRDGPTIRVDHPEQIEILDHGSDGGSADGG